MVLRGVQYFLIFTLLALSFTSAKSKKALCFESDSATDEDHFVKSIATLLKNFAKLGRSESFGERDGNDYFAEVLRYEFYTMSTGKRFIISPPADLKLEKKQREVAFIVSGIWMGLYTAEKVDSLLNKVFDTAVTQHWSKREPLTMGLMQATLQSVINQLSKGMEDDPELSLFLANAQYEYRLEHYLTTSSRQKVYFSFDEITRGRVNKGPIYAWLEDVSVRYCFIHSQFLGMRKEDGKNRVWARSILETARKLPHHSKMQLIYTNAVNETGLNFVAEDFPSGTMRVFVDKINKAVAADDELKKGMEGGA